MNTQDEKSTHTATSWMDGKLIELSVIKVHGTSDEWTTHQHEKYLNLSMQYGLGLERNTPKRQAMRAIPTRRKINCLDRWASKGDGYRVQWPLSNKDKLAVALRKTHKQQVRKTRVRNNRRPVMHLQEIRIRLLRCRKFRIAQLIQPNSYKDTAMKN